MKWTVKLVAETQPGMTIEQDVMSIDRGDLLCPASAGLSIAEGKAILEGLQHRIVAEQAKRHGAHVKSCLQCGKVFRTKGYYQTTLRSVYGNVPMRVRRIKGCSCTGSESRTYSTIFTNKNPITPELRYLTSKMAALLPFGKAAQFLSELLPLSTRTSVNTVRNRTMKVGRRLQKSADALVGASAVTPCKEAFIGLDGGYVRSRHQRPERNFEIVAGKVLDDSGNATRFAFVRQSGTEGVNAADVALRRSGVNEKTSLTVLTDGDAGLRAIHQRLEVRGEHVLDWFHIGMKFQNLKQIGKGVQDATICSHALDTLEKAKWRFWNGQVDRGLACLTELSQWSRARCCENIPTLDKLSKALLDAIRYFELNADSMPDYGKRFRARSRISTGFAESAVNEIISKRMVKKQQMRWSRHSVQPFLEVRVHVLNNTLQDAFRHWHSGFRPPSHSVPDTTAA